MRLLVLILAIACVCAHPHTDNYKLTIDELRSTDFPAVKTGMSKALKGRDLDDCSLGALFSQDLMNLCSDEIFQEVDDYVAQNYEPLDLPDENAGFSYTLVVTFQGALNLTQGKLYDLSTLHRDGDVQIVADIATAHVNLSLPIVLDRVDIRYDYKAEIMGLGPEGGIEGHIDNLELAFKLSYDPAANQIHLDDFEIVHEGDIFFDFTGNPVVDWLAELLADVVTDILHTTVQNLVHEVILSIVQGAIDAVNDALANGAGVAAPGLSQDVYKTLLDNKIIQFKIDN